MVKPNALILVPALLKLRASRVLGLGLLAGSLTSLPYFLLHPDSVAAFFAANVYGSPVQGALTHAGNLGLQGGLVSVAAQLAGRPLAELTTLADLPFAGRTAIYCSQTVILLAALVATWRGRDALPLLALWMCTFFSCTKTFGEHHYVFLQPVLVALYVRSGSPKLLWIFAFIALPTPFVFFDIEPMVYGPIDPERTWGPPRFHCLSQHQTHSSRLPVVRAVPHVLGRCTCQALDISVPEPYYILFSFGLSHLSYGI